MDAALFTDMTRCRIPLQHLLQLQECIRWFQEFSLRRALLQGQEKKSGGSSEGKRRCKGWYHDGYNIKSQDKKKPVTRSHKGTMAFFFRRLVQNQRVRDVKIPKWPTQEKVNGFVTSATHTYTFPAWLVFDADFQNEETALRHLGRTIGVAVDCAPIFCAELAGESNTLEVTWSNCILGNLLLWRKAGTTSRLWFGAALIQRQKLTRCVWEILLAEHEPTLALTLSWRGVETNRTKKKPMAMFQGGNGPILLKSNDLWSHSRLINVP